ncbi:MAG: iron-containing alcohol dehydrogenase [Christensenella hongkongensis]|uniref:iron-containing alcohol dehydrogenase n=1 Tax=Christensenella hongkongensis TaxID=270498 RepID=UPI002A761331|nr:iron-containing alcohol dehydrogenase [Christensenella hongkongensis]MDY3004208.1 iron-containing alcohol dehydrogenase [Christensenella hongkongensis]
MRKSFKYYMPTRILFGPGSLGKLSRQKLPGKRALIVTTNGTSVVKYGYLDTLTGQLQEAGVEFVLFNKILPNPIKDHVMEGAQLCKEYRLDFVVGLGGGSAIDAAKAIAVMAANPGDYWDYVSGGSGKGQPVPNAPLPVVAITTTAGTGTEADPWTVTTKTETNEKIGFGYDGTFPVLAVVDPELMVSVPKYLTACQGFDALFHSTEGYLSTAADALGDLYSYRAIELVGKSLAKAVQDGADIDARSDIALANTLAGMSESTSGCISEHSLAHALGAYHQNLEHGAALIAISAQYYTFMAKSGACDERMVKMARALGKEDARNPMDFVDALVQLQKDCGVADIKLSEYGVNYDELPKYVANARETMGGLFEADPAEPSDAAALEILQKSYR